MYECRSGVRYAVKASTVDQLGSLQCQTFYGTATYDTNNYETISCGIITYAMPSFGKKLLWESSYEIALYGIIRSKITLNQATGVPHSCFRVFSFSLLLLCYGNNVCDSTAQVNVRGIFKGGSRGVTSLSDVRRDSRPGQSIMLKYFKSETPRRACTQTSNALACFQSIRFCNTAYE